MTKLEETNAVVEGLQVELTALQPVLKEKAEAAAKMIIVVERDQKEADIVKAKVEKVVEVVSKQAAETKVIADDAQADLDEAMPAFNNALKALDSLSKDDITEIKKILRSLQRWCRSLWKLYAFCSDEIRTGNQRRHYFRNQILWIN